MKMQKNNNLIRKVMGGVSGLALLVSLEGCGTTIPYQDKTTQIWYDCNTSIDYPSGHPCYSEVANYNAVHGSSSSKSNSCIQEKYPGCCGYGMDTKSANRLEK